jgi:hypothetical protein
MAIGAAILIAGFSVSCSDLSRLFEKELARFPADGLDGVVAPYGVEFDRDISSDGKGSLKVKAELPGFVQLYKVGDLDIENAVLVYKAELRAENLEGQAFLEMWVGFPGKGEFFSRGLHKTVSGTTGWKDAEAVFNLNKGDNPDRVGLYLSIQGKGTVWIDNIRLVKRPR